MQVEIIRKQPGGDWNSFGMFARQRLQIQTSRIQYGHRLLAMERLNLVEQGLYMEIQETLKHPETGKEAVGKKYKPRDNTEETAAEIAQARARIYEMPVYVLMKKYWRQLKKFEEDMGKDAIELVKDYSVTKFCEDVRGLGYISALTFLSYFNPLRTKSPSNWMSMLGWTKGSRFKKGQQGHSNPVAKGRTYMCCSGVILQRDPYYKPLFDIKKVYLNGRPDFVHLRDDIKKKGVKAHINLLSMEFVIKLILNHAFELMYLDYWGVPYYQSEEYARVRHKNHIPRPNAIDQEQWKLVHEISQRANDRILIDAWEQWDKDKSDPLDKCNSNIQTPYRQWIDHIPLEVYLQGEKIPG